MGLGSDSVPVSVSLHGETTHLADSMQFTLEYVLRMEENIRGAYYIGCSFRGEDHDQMHLNQFYHVECEIPGTCADLLLGQGETLGLGQRHVDAETVQKALRMHEVPEQSYEWYMGIRNDAKGGKAMETTGWGMGIERFLAWLLKHDDIRDFAIIPRLKNMKFAP